MRRVRDQALQALPLDADGAVSGFQFDGRARRLAAWRDAKDARAFKELCRRLYQARYQRRYYRAHAGVRERSRDRLRARRRRAALERTCRNCSAVWVNVPGLGRGGKPPTRYCSKRCRVQWHNRELVGKRKESGFWKQNWRRWHKPCKAAF